MDKRTMTSPANPFIRVRFARPQGTVLLATAARWGKGTTVSADGCSTPGSWTAFIGGTVIAPNAQQYMDVAHVRTGEPPV
jgi:hypothetical protein